MTRSENLPPSFLSLLILIGRTEKFTDLSELLAAFPVQAKGGFMRQSPEFWYGIADTLSDDDLEALIKALTIAERDFVSLQGGSVSGIIWAFRRLQQRKNSDQLANWILANTSNYWAPFGAGNGGAKSLSELNELYALSATETLARREAFLRRESVDRSVALERRRRRAAEAIGHAERAKTLRATRSRAIEELTAMSGEERLIAVAEDRFQLPLDAIPSELLPSDVPILSRLPAPARMALARRIDRRSGRYQSLREALELVLE